MKASFICKVVIPIQGGHTHTRVAYTYKGTYNKSNILVYTKYLYMQRTHTKRSFLYKEVTTIHMGYTYTKGSNLYK